MSQLHPIHSFNPYESSDDEENTLISQNEDAYSHTSQSGRTPQFITHQRQSLCCPKPTYTKTRRALNKIFKTRGDLEVVSLELEQERSRGRCLIVACVIMSLLCGFLFIDRWPEDWREDLIAKLEQGRKVDTDEKKYDDPLDAFRTQEKTSNDDDDHYSKNGSTYDTYKKTHKKSHSKGGSSTHKKETNVKEQTQDDDDEEEVDEEEETDDESEDDDTSASSSQDSIDSKRIKENEQQHIDNLSKYLKWNLPYKQDRDIPVYWHIPLTGTMLLDEILGKCYKLVQAADDPSLLAGHEEDNILKVVSMNSNSNRYINVDMGSVSGIKRAKKLHLARSGAVELIRTSYLYEAAFLFENTAKYGKCFTLLRSPIQRSIDVFHKLKSTSSSRVFNSMTLQEYVKSSYIEDNWMVRVLSNEMEAEMTEQHLDLAKHILARKFIVGFAEDFEESMRRFSKYFHWDQEITKEKLQKCQEDLEISKHIASGEFTAFTDTNDVRKGDEVYNILREKNAFDIELFQYAQGLYKTQALYGRLL